MMSYTLIGLLTCVLVGSGSVLAQVPDPTRPPEAWLVPGPASGGPITTDSGIQTVILRPGGKSAAVINGQYVSLGDMIGDKQVIKITESEVVLKSDTGREIIKVMPSVEKTPAASKTGKWGRTGNTEK